MTRTQARRFAAIALACVRREFPNHPGHVLRSARERVRPRDLHPAFYGAFDWHSAVHGHWLLAHVLRRFPGIPEAAAIRRVLAAHLTPANLALERRYLEEHPGFERPYGWVWLLKLAMEDARLAPLARTVEKRYLAWLPKQAYPIRAGTHVNTAFGLGFALDYARTFNRENLESRIVKSALAFYGRDMDYPAHLEPGGNDFLSPALVEADLMRRVLPPARFRRWFGRFLPVVPRSLREPAKVTDRGDGQLAHLDGLNLSRAWCFYRLGMKVPGDRHYKAGLAGLRPGHYEGEHWLATFAAYAAACAFEGATTAPAARRRAT